MTVFVIVAVVCVVILSPVVLTLSVVSQVYEDGTLLVSARLIAAALHTETAPELVIEGSGFTVTDTV